MGREGAEALLDTLLIPDICINVMEYGQFGAVQRRDVKAPPGPISVKRPTVI